MTAPSTTSGPSVWRRRLIQALVAIGMGLAGAAFGALAATLAGGRGAGGERNWGELAALLGSAVVLSPLAILAHELGHLAGGRLVGFRFLLLIAGPLKVQRIGERVHIGLNRSLGLSGGLAACAPADSENLPRRMLAMVAGGPLASLLTGALALAALPAAGGLAAGMILLFGVISLAIAAATLLPIQSGGFQSDGRRLLMLLRGGPASERWCAAAAAAFSSLSGRPREIHPGLIAAATALPDGSIDDVGAHLLGYSAALDAGDLAAAAAHLSYALDRREGYPAPLRPILLLEGAYMAARQGDAAAARAYLDQARGDGLIEPYTRARVEAAVLRAEGRADESEDRARAGLAALARLRPGAAAALDADLLRDLARI